MTAALPLTDRAALAAVGRKLRLILVLALCLSAAVLAGAAVVQLLGHSREAVKFTFALLALIGVGPLAGAAALALDRPRLGLGLSIGPGLLVAILLLTSG